MSYTFEQVKTDDKTLDLTRELLSTTFANWDTQYSIEYLKWQYRDNPAGSVVGYNAISETGELAAHYATIPIHTLVNGRQEKSLLSLNTATHPNHRGKGLFIKLAEMTYETAAKKGFASVVGVANQNSTPGFIRKLGFQLVCALDVKVGLGELPRSESDPNQAEFRLLKSPEIVSWRLRKPGAKYSLDSNNTVYSKTRFYGINAILCRLIEEQEIPKEIGKTGLLPHFKLWIGLDDTLNWKKSLFFTLPRLFRPSPLNFIFKDLTGKSLYISRDKVIIDAFDFDAF